MTKAKHGVYAAAITPIDVHGAPDGAALVRHCQRLLADGLDGVAPLGTTGEGNSLPLSFRLDVPAVFADAGLRSDEVIFGTGACAVADAVKTTQASLGAGYPNVLVLPPFYLKNVSDDGLYAYYARIVEEVADPRLRIYLYHFPQMSMTPISVDLITRLKRDFGAVIAGLKDSSGNYEGTLRFVSAADDFDVFPSGEGVLLKAVEAGCAGVISATTNASARLVRRTLNAKGPERAALQERLGAVRAAIAKHPLSPALKQVEAWRSGDNAWRRVLPPLVELPAEAARTLRADLDALPETSVLDCAPAAA